MVVLTIANENMPESRAKKRLQNFVKGRFDVPVLLGNSAVFQAYGIESIPRLIVLNTDGEVEVSHVGNMPFAELATEVQKAAD